MVNGMGVGKALAISLDKALAVQRPLVLAAIGRHRNRRSAAAPVDVIRSLEKQYMAAMIGTGAAVGGVAAAPVVGTGAALALSVGEILPFLEASALFTLAVAEIYGVRVDDLERRRTLLLAVLLGDAGANLVEKAAERTGKHWGRLLVKKIPMSGINRLNRILGRWFVTKYGTRQGILVLGRLVPFGVGAAIGGVGNAVFARTVVVGARRAFGPPPTRWTPPIPHSDEPGDARDRVPV
jgi:hypothetical protein